MKFCVGLTLLSCLIGNLPCAAQEPPKVLRSQSTVTLVPITVLDQHGRPVKNLQKSDFELRVDNKPVSITAFDVYSAARGSASAKTTAVAKDQTEEAPSIIANVPIQTNPTAPILLVLLDDLNTSVAERLNNRDQALDFLSHRLTPGQLVAIYGLGYTLVPLQALTSDPSKFVSAAKQSTGTLLVRTPAEAGALSWGKSGSDQAMEYYATRNARRDFVSSQRDRYARTLAALRQLADAYRGVPGRKILLWLTEDLSPLNPSMLYQFLRNEQPLEAPHGSWAQLARVYETLNSANISIYPVDTRGIRNYSLLPASQKLTHSEFDDARRGAQPGEVDAYSGDSNRRQGEAGNAALAMEAVAVETGGQVLKGENAVDDLLDRSQSYWSDYYVLSFIPPPSDKALYRHISVRVRQHGSKLLYRQGFFEPGTTMHPDVKQSISEALRSPIDSSAVPLELSLYKNTPTYKLKIAMNESSLSDPDRQYNLVIVTAVMDKSGNVLHTSDEELSAKVNADVTEDFLRAGVAHEGRLPIADKKQYYGRIIVADKASGLVGSVTTVLPAASAP